MDEFFHSFIGKNTSQAIRKLIVVTHLVPGSDEFLLPVNKKLPIAALIPKPTSINQRVRDIIHSKIPVLDYRREQIKSQPAKFLEKLRNLVGDSSFAIIDTGGYFSHVLYELHTMFGDQLVGIVEDTENGHQKYEALLTKISGRTTYPCPIVSVARSTLKDPEDFLVGQAITFSAEALLRECGEILNGKKALVLGYGKIGRSIAYHLRLKSVLTKVLDTNPSRQVLALAHGFQTDKKEQLIADADMIFCATGNLSLKRRDIISIKRDAYIFTATSGDDEIENHSHLINIASHDGRRAISRVELDGNRFHICNNGNSINFVHGGVVGPYIRLVQAELVFALSQLDEAPLDKITELDYNAKRLIADAWMTRFSV